MDEDIRRRRANVLKMPKRVSGNQGKIPPVSHNGPEHIIRYPRVQSENYYADFMRDKRVYPEVYHCVIQREGSNEIHSWTQHSSLEEASKQAEAALALLLSSNATKSRISEKRTAISGPSST